jgi:predicted dithiol-disulfide oxidoreductase (DUF899 family)
MAPRIVSPEVWRAERIALLAEEKAFDRARDALSARRRSLPVTEVTKAYSFGTASGPVTLAELFDGRRQLIVYHFMFGADWEQGCPSCSFWADNFDGIGIHLAHRDTTLVAVSIAPFEKLAAYRNRMGWSFPWVSSHGSDFNQDFGVTMPEGEAVPDYNYAPRPGAKGELPGISVFMQEDGRVLRSYSTYARGLDMLNGAYHFLDLTPFGRQEADLPWSMAWVRRHDQYEN